MRRLFIIVIAVALYCSGCSSSYHIKIDSDPQSAKMICGGNVVGLTPLDFSISEEEQEKRKTSSGELDMGTPCDIVWASGAKTKTPRFFRIYDSGGTVFTAQRPNDHPNAELDYQIDYRNKQIKLQNEQLQLQNEQLQIQRQQLYEMSRPRTTNCYSDFFGNVHCRSF